MYARLTTVRADPDRIDELAEKLAELKTQLMAIRGLVSHKVAWRSDGLCIAMAIYDTKESAIAATTQVQGMLATVAEYLIEPPVVEAFENADDMLFGKHSEKFDPAV